MESETRGAKVTDVVCGVVFVQFEDGTTWGNRETGKEMLDNRPKELAFLKYLVETYYESGEDAFNAMLNDRSIEGPEWLLAMMLRDADTPAIDLAKKQFQLLRDGMPRVFFSRRYFSQYQPQRRGDSCS